MRVREISVSSEELLDGDYSTQLGALFPRTKHRLTAMDYLSLATGQKAYENHRAFVMDGKLCGVTAITSAEGISYFDRPALMEVAADLQPELERKVWEGLAQLMKTEAGTGAACSVSFFPENSIINEVFSSSLIQESEIGLGFEGIFDFSLSGSSIEAGIRKSHRQSIRAAISSGLETRIISNQFAYSEMDDFRNLHITSAGRETRSKESWSEMHSAVSRGDAVLCVIRKDDADVGFNFTWTDSLLATYASAAYDRTLFGKYPISHLGLLRVIEHCKEIGREGVILGEVFARGGTAKERSIASFKRGFANVVRMNLQLAIGA